MENGNEKIFRIVVDSRAGADNLRKIEAEIKRCQREAKRLASVEKSLGEQRSQGRLTEAQYSKALKANTAAAADNRRNLYALNDERRRSVAELKQQVVAERAQKDSIVQIQARLTALRLSYRNLSAEQRDNRAVGGALLREITQLSSQYKKLESSMGKGSFSGKLKHLLSISGLQILSLVKVSQLIFSALKNAGKTVMEFEQANANLATILGTTRDRITELTESARALGVATEWSASQVTQLQTELAKLGFGQRDILNMQASVLQFATAVGADLPEAASLAGASLRAFNLDSAETERVTSVMAVGTNRSALSFEYLKTSLAIVSPIAHAFGFTIEDTVALLGALANAGFDASSAATATRNILLNLADANGRLAQKIGAPVKTLPELIAGLQRLSAEGVDLNATLELTDKRSVAAFNTFLHGTEALSSLRNSLADTGGELKRIQEERLDTVEGSVKLLNSAWQELMLSFSGSAGPMKTVVDGLTQLLRVIQRHIDPDADFSQGLAELPGRLMKSYNNALESIKEYAPTLVQAQADALSALNESTKKSMDEHQALIDQYAAKINSLKESIKGFEGLGILGRPAIKGFEKEIAKLDDAIAHQTRIIKAYKEAHASVVESVTKKPEEQAAAAKETPEQQRVRLSRASYAELERIAQESDNKQEKRQAAQLLRERSTAARAREQNRRDREAEQERYRNLSTKNEQAVQEQEKMTRQAGIALMQEGVTKRLALSEQATQQETERLRQNYAARMAETDRELEKQRELHQEGSAAYMALEEQKTRLKAAYDAAKTSIEKKGAAEREKIIHDATDREIDEYKRGGAAYDNVQLDKVRSARKAEELKKSAAAVYVKADEGIREAENTYAVQKQLINLTETEERKRKDALMQNEIDIRKAKYDTYLSELRAMQALGLVDDERFQQTQQQMKQLKGEMLNIGKGKEPDGTDNRGFLEKIFSLTDRQKQKLKEEAFELASQINSAVADAEKQSVDRRLKLEQKRIDDQANSEKKALKSRKDKGLISEKTYQKKLQEIDDKTDKLREEAERKAFERKKRIDTMAAIMNTALAVSKIWADVPKFDFGASTIALTAIALAEGAVQVATIQAQKFTRGGLLPAREKKRGGSSPGGGSIVPVGDGGGGISMGQLKGPSHARGGIRVYFEGSPRPFAELEGDEVLAVVNKNSANRYLPELSEINRAGGGRKFAEGGIISPRPLFVPRPGPLPNYGRIARQEEQDYRAETARQNREIIDRIDRNIQRVNDRIDTLKVYVVESDITKAQKNVKKVQTMATF